MGRTILEATTSPYARAAAEIRPPRGPRRVAGMVEAHHTRPKGVWLVSYRKSTGKPTVTYDEAVEEALCFGWVDSRPGTLDDARTMLYFAPRRPKSGRAATNKARVARLIAEGRMAPAGLAKSEAAEADG